MCITKYSGMHLAFQRNGAKWEQSVKCDCDDEIKLSSEWRDGHETQTRCAATASELNNLTTRAFKSSDQNLKRLK